LFSIRRGRQWISAVAFDHRLPKLIDKDGGTLLKNRLESNCTAFFEPVVGHGDGRLEDQWRQPSEIESYIVLGNLANAGPGRSFITVFLQESGQ